MNTRPNHSRRRAGAALPPARRPVSLPRRRRRSDAFARFLRNRTPAGGGGVPPPRAVAGAEWQPGVTCGADGLRPTLDGEPVPGALAASVTAGWVRVAPLNLLRPPQRGLVRLVPVSRACR
jgi:hypothetical protein